MVLSLFSLGTESTASIREAQSAVEAAFKHILDEQFAFETFGNEKEFLSRLSSAVATDHIIVLGSEAALFPAFKTFVCNSFQLKCKPNKSIQKAITTAHPELDEATVVEQSNIPSNASPLITQDGVYSGFAMKAKKQLLIVLPLDDKRIDSIINNGIYPFVRTNMDMSLLIADPLKNVDGSKVKPEEPKAAMYNPEEIKATVKKLMEMGLSVAVANTKTVDFLSNISTTSVDLSKVVFISSYDAPKGERSAREYAIDLAKGALANSTNSVGAAITKVFSIVDEEGKPQFFMYICIADKENANVAKLTAENGETPPQLIYKAIEELFCMLNLWADTGYAKPQFTDEVVVRENKEAAETDKKIGKMKTIVSGMVAASFLISLAVSFLAQDVYGIF